jgi:CBS-domain-containing membrane protein
MKIKKIIIVLLGSFLSISLVFYLISLSSSDIWLSFLCESRAALLFTASSSSASQPRALIGGHLICALTGITLFHFFDDYWWVLSTVIDYSVFY